MSYFRKRYFKTHSLSELDLPLVYLPCRFVAASVRTTIIAAKAQSLKLFPENQTA